MNKLREYASIKNITTLNGTPGDVHFSMGSGIKDKDKHLFCIPTDSNFNETAYKYFGWDNLENKYYNNGRKGGFKVIGVVKDFHIASMHQPIGWYEQMSSGFCIQN